MGVLMETVSGGLEQWTGNGALDYSAVVGSMMFMTWDTLLAGKPPCLACSRMSSSFGAMYTQ
ncbi:hypothetical protein D3C85_1912440 [compost metagenome]